MDKQEAIKRLDALEGEAKKLREIIEKDDKPIYDESKIYVGLEDGMPYIMAGEEESGFRFFPFVGCKTETSYSCGKKTGQECLDYHLDDGFEIHAFDDTREAFQFFLDNLK